MWGLEFSSQHKKKKKNGARGKEEIKLPLTVPGREEMVSGTCKRVGPCVRTIPEVTKSPETKYDSNPVSHSLGLDSHVKAPGLLIPSA